MQVTSPTSRGTRGGRPGPLTVRSALVAGLVLGLFAGLGPLAAADDLSDARDRVRAELALKRKQMAADKAALARAAGTLADSRARLASAQQNLAEVETRLAAARERDARIAEDLAAAEQALRSAEDAVALAEADVARQRALIAVAVRSAYQQQTTLVGFSLVLGSTSAAELAQRVQWSTTIFDATTSQYDRLTQLEAQLEAARLERAGARASLAEKRRASAEQVAEIKALTAAAAEQQAEIARIVDSNAVLKAEARAELKKTQAAYEALQAEEERIAAKLRARDDGIVNENGFVRPVDAPAGSPFGMRFHPILRYWRMHWGTDFGAACGTPLRAMADGRVVSAGWTSNGFGYYTIISYGTLNGDALASGYAHQAKVIVRAGQRVRQGEIVGYVGTTGLSTGCHLHLQVYRDGVRVDPMRYL